VRTSGPDRRKATRADLRLPIELSGGQGDALSVSTLNIGAGGVYLRVPRFIAPLTKVSLSMRIPGPTPSDAPAFVETEAIVVRTVPEEATDGAEGYEIACAFLALADEHRDAIHRYVLTHRATPVL
jgi:hypothetical protein